MSTAPPRTQTRPLQYCYDSGSERVDVVVDVTPASREELTVLVGDDRIELHVDGEDGLERRFRTPATDWTFGDERSAVYNNGVLTISVETLGSD